MGRLAKKPLAWFVMLAGYGAFAGCGGRALEDGVNSTATAGARPFAGAPAVGSAGASSFAGALSSGGAANFGGASPSGGSTSAAGAPQFDWGECAQNEDCTLIPANCCEACEPIVFSDLLAVSNQWVDRYHSTHCGFGVACGPCASPATEYDETRKYFRAVCRQGECAVLDTRGTLFSSCVTYSDCTLREGVECCPGCDGHGWVPVNNTIDFCAIPATCGNCVSVPPSDLKTVCSGGECRFAAPVR